MPQVTHLINIRNSLCTVLEAEEPGIKVSTDVSIKSFISKSKMVPYRGDQARQRAQGSQVRKVCISLFLTSFCTHTNQPSSRRRSHQAKSPCLIAPPLTTLGPSIRGPCQQQPLQPTFPAACIFPKTSHGVFPQHTFPHLGSAPDCPSLLSSVVPRWLPRTMLGSGNVEVTYSWVLLRRLSGPITGDYAKFAE